VIATLAGHPIACHPSTSWTVGDGYLPKVRWADRWRQCGHHRAV